MAWGFIGESVNLARGRQSLEAVFELKSIDEKDPVIQRYVEECIFDLGNYKYKGSGGLGPAVLSTARYQMWPQTQSLGW